MVVVAILEVLVGVLGGQLTVGCPPLIGRRGLGVRPRHPIPLPLWGILVFGSTRGCLDATVVFRSVQTLGEFVRTATWKRKALGEFLPGACMSRSRLDAVFRVACLRISSWSCLEADFLKDLYINLYRMFDSAGRSWMELSDVFYLQAQLV